MIFLAAQHAETYLYHCDTTRGAEVGNYEKIVILVSGFGTDAHTHQILTEHTPFIPHNSLHTHHCRLLTLASPFAQFPTQLAPSLGAPKHYLLLTLASESRRNWACTANVAGIAQVLTI